MLIVNSAVVFGVVASGGQVDYANLQSDNFDPSKHSYDVFLSKNPVVKAYSKNVMRVQPLTNQPSDFDNNYGNKKYTYVATSKQQLDFKVQDLKERLANTSDESMKKYIQSDIDWEWTKYNKREQKQEATAAGQAPAPQAPKHKQSTARIPVPLENASHSPPFQ